MMRKKVTIVSVETVSYSGTTWLNLVLGSHPSAFTLGPPDRVWSLRDKGFNNACRVWGKKDTFWKGFNEHWDREENFFISLADYAGVTHIVFDSPSETIRRDLMTHPDIEVKVPVYLRDARAVTASYARKNPDIPYLNTILPDGWFYHSYQALNSAPPSPDRKIFYYEEAVADPLGFLSKIGPFLGLQYTDAALRFWEHDHHITTGNQGTIGLLKLANNLPIQEFKGHEFYRQRLEDMRKNYLHGFVDERWKDELRRLDRFYFDVVLGGKHAELGFSCDEFEQDEAKELLARYEEEVADGICNVIPEFILSPYLSSKGLSSVDRIAQLKKFAFDNKVRAKRALLVLRDRRKRLPALSNLAAWKNLVRRNAARALPAAASSQPVPFPVPESGTQYYDSVRDEMHASFTPYRVKPSSWSLNNVLESVNRNVFIGYGPDYDVKPSFGLVADAPSRYDELLRGVLDVQGTKFFAARDLVGRNPGPGEVCCHVRHDVDADLAGALQQARIEAALGIQTTYYILHTAAYYGTWTGVRFERNEAAAEIYLKIQELGHEIALHTDALGLYQFQNTQGAEGLSTELDWLRSQGLKINGSVAHNSFGVYGAENFAIFKGQPLKMHGETKGHAAVAHDGKLALLQQLDENELSLEYEGNQLLSQKDVPIQYYALRGMNDWRHQTFNRGLLEEGVNAHKQKSNWFSQEEVVDHLGRSKKGIYAFFIVHPVYYGLRAGAASEPAIGLESPAPRAKTKLGWRGYNAGTISARSTKIDDQATYQSVVKITDLGFPDVPLSYIEGLDRRIAMLGKDQFASDRISTECKAHRAFARVMRRHHNKEFGVFCMAGECAPLSVRLSWLHQMRKATKFTDVVVSIGLSDLLCEQEENLRACWECDQAVALQLLPRSFSAASLPAAEQLGKISNVPVGPQKCAAVVDALMAAIGDGSKIAELMDPVSRRVESAVSHLKSEGYNVVLLLEDCGEPAGVDWSELTPRSRASLIEHAGNWAERLARSCAVPAADPYQQMQSYDGAAKTHWPNQNCWSIHGHTLAGHALVKAFLG